MKHMKSMKYFFLLSEKKNVTVHGVLQKKLNGCGRIKSLLLLGLKGQDNLAQGNALGLREAPNETP